MQTKIAHSREPKPARAARQNYFAGFADHVQLRRNTPARLGSFEFNFVRSGTDNGLMIQVHHDGMRIMLERIPPVFYMGEMQASEVQIGGNGYLLLAANSRTSSQRMWFGIYRPDGSKLYAAGLEQSLAQVQQNADGISLMFVSGDTMRIKI